MDYVYVPNDIILEKYAKLLVNFGLNNGEGIKKNEVVLISVPECAKPILKFIYREVLKNGSHPIVNFIPDDLATEIYNYGNDEQISYFPAKLLKGRADEINHNIMILADKNPKELANIDPKKIMLKQKSVLPYRQWIDEKENKGMYSWTLCLYPTLAKAKEAKMNLKEYWDKVIDACYLNDENPIEKWKSIQNQVKTTIKKLDSLPIDKIHVKSEKIDLWLRLGEKRKWVGCDGCNIPSFEIFTSPDWRGTNGYIEFSEPLYRYGNLIEGIKFEFKDGVIVNASATKNENILKELISVENANKIGEFSLTDSRFSKITSFMAETLFDENVGGKFGNTHIAIGSAYDSTYNGNVLDLNENTRKKLGFNKSAIHCDIVSTADRIVTAHLKDGTEKIIFKNGQFKV
ncbi:aminopeptidase [Candidatus Woesearchaeota archaeon]|nr:aminopeptidase [Candidatus Woesearchaeota archaeon]